MYVVGTFLSAIGIISVILIVIAWLLRQKSSLIFDKYPKKGVFYQVKYVISLFLLKRLRNKLYPRNEIKDDMQQYDKPQTLSDDPQSYDFVSFVAMNSEGEKCIISLERRRRGIFKACIYLWLPAEGLWCLPKLPDMLYFTTDGKQESMEFRGSGFHIYPAKPMCTWRIEYTGQLKQVTSNKVMQAKFDLTFSSHSTSYFNYNRDLSASVIADSVAREAWNDSFYGMLKNVPRLVEKRMHYEQHGKLEGKIQIGDRELILKMIGFRDHSFGTERCLSSINRYVYFSLFLDDGTAMVIGILSQPSFFLSSLKVGYLCTKSGEYQPITECNFELYTYGEKGTPPQHQNFIVHTDMGKYFVQIQEEDAAIRYIGGDWQSKVYNQFISCTVNGIKGQGVTEFLYRHDGGRPDAVGSNDPEWYQEIRKYEKSLSAGQNADRDEEFIF